MAAAKWKPAKLDELGFVGRGKSRHRPRNAAFLYGGRYPFFQTGDIKAANLHLTEYSQTYSEEGLAQSKLWKPGTLCITIAANIAESAILGIEGCFPDSVVGFVADPDKADVRFVKYYMEILKLQMQSVSRGTTQDNLSLDKLLTFDFLVPPLPVQRRIAGILSAYGELMENSQRRIRLLEAMARALYREWCVYFRFPGHEKLPRVASPFGDIPQGWEVKTLGQIAENFDRLRKPLSKMQRAEIQGEYPYYGAAKVFDYINDFIFEGEYLLMAEDGSVITTERAPVLQLANEKFWPNNHTHVLRGKPPFSTHFLYLGLSEVDISPYITGAAQPKITQENMNRIPFFCGPEKLHQEFNRLVAPMIRKSQLLQRQIQNLRRTRDLLLPRLLLGQVELNTN
jgi:type I restriction enzyme S subunit